MAEILTINEADFKDHVLDSTIPVIVEFGAPWCVPCKRIEPFLVELTEKEWLNREKLVKIEVDNNASLTMKYQVMSVPTILFFKNGEPVERLIGSQSREQIFKKISIHL